jgi:hypothetical protein
MKSIKGLREQYDLITEKEEAEVRKLSALVRAGLFDAKKLTSLKRALEKPVDKMTAQEKRMLLNLLDSLMSEVLSNQPVYQKVKQNVMKENKDNFVSDRRFGRGYPSQKDMPSVLLLKRKAIRVFPDGQKVGLYYAQAIDKYVTIPFSEIGINEEVELNEIAPALVPLAVGAARVAAPVIARGAARVGAAGLKYGKKAWDAWKKSRAVKKAEKAKDKVSRGGTITNADRLARRKAIAKGIKQRSSRAGGRWRNIGRGAKAVATGAAAVGAALSGGSSGDNKKYFTPMSPTLKATTVGPKREGGSDARAERERQASFRASKSMATNESVEVNLDGNLFELNNKAANKITKLYESLNNKNKRKMISMMNESGESLNKIVSFALGQK